MAVVDIKYIPEVKHVSREITTKNDGRTVKLTFIGFRDPIYALNDSLKIGDIDEEYGRLNVKKLHQQEGPHWLLDLEWEIEYANNTGDSGGTGGSGGSGSNTRPKGTSKRPSTSSLNCSMMSVPIEMHPNYRMRWNKFLYCKYDLYGNSPGVSEDLKNKLQAWVTAHYDDQVDINPNDKIDLGVDYNGSKPVCEVFKWVKNQSSVPFDKNGSKIWYMAIKILKPGLEKFDMPIYTLTEYSYHSNPSLASWVVSARAGKIAYPMNGDFGIDQRLGGNWLCKGGSIRFNGDGYWVAELQYAHSGDYLLTNIFPRYRGWDPQIYLFFNPNYNYNQFFYNGATSLSGFNDWDNVQNSNKQAYEKEGDEAPEGSYGPAVEARRKLIEGYYDDGGEN